MNNLTKFNTPETRFAGTMQRKIRLAGCTKLTCQSVNRFNPK
jgi:hypothetical protein